MADTTPAGQTYSFEVEGVGSFVARRRTMRDSAAIPARINQIVGKIDEDTAAGVIWQATMLAELEMLIVQAPDWWDMSLFDPLDQGDMEFVVKAHGGLRAAEEKFRAAAKAKRPRLGD